MATFTYQAADRRGRTIDGVMEAPDIHAVIAQLQRDTYYPIRVTPQEAAGRPARPLRAAWMPRGSDEIGRASCRERV